MKTSFQAGVDKLYYRCRDLGATPSASNPDRIYDAIGTIYTNRYNSGVTDADNRANPGCVNYNAGVTAADARSNPNSANYKAGYNAGKSVGLSAAYGLPFMISNVNLRFSGDGNTLHGYIMTYVTLYWLKTCTVSGVSITGFSSEEGKNISIPSSAFNGYHAAGSTTIFNTHADRAYVQSDTSTTNWNTWISLNNASVVYH